MRAAIFMLFVIIGLTPSYSQFYDVKIKKSIRSVSTRSETDPPEIKKMLFASEKSDNCPEKMDGHVLRDGTEDSGESMEKDSTSTGKKALMFSAPLDSLVVTSGYGYRKDPFTGKRKFHAGTDYRTASENVYAMMPGRIRKIGYDKRLGNYITIDHGDIRVTYAHLHTVVGEKGETVHAGQSVGISGSTGRSTGEHLHVSIRYKKEVVDPDPLIRVIRNFGSTGMMESREDN